MRDYATCAYAMNVWCRDDRYVLICRNTGEEPQLYRPEERSAADGERCLGQAAEW